MKIGSTTINSCKIGSTQVNEVRIGSTLVWSYSFDPDAQAFITAAGIIDPTQQTAVNNLVVALKGYSIWTKFKALYPFVGGTATTHKFNLKNPLDTDAAFRLVFSGGWTHSVNGVKGNGTNSYADLFLSPASILTNNSTHLSYYCRENIYGAFCDFGIQASGADLSTYNYLGTYYSDQYNQGTGRASFALSDTRGFIIGSRTTSSIHKIFRNGSQIGATNTGSSGTLSGITNTIFFGAARQYTAANYFSSRQYAIASIGDGLTDTEAANYYTAVQAFQTSLSRNI